MIGLHLCVVLQQAVSLYLISTFDERVTGAYKWLSNIFEFGDRIFIYGMLPFHPCCCGVRDDDKFYLGFSRGAYQARTLASMIHKVRLSQVWFSCC